MASLVCRSLLRKTPRHAKEVVRVPVRCLNLLEHQSKRLLENHGMAVQRFALVENADQARDVAKTFTANEYVVKAMVLAGGRGLGHFDNGFKSGVHLTKDATALSGLCTNMLGHRLITKQTPKDGIMVNSVMVAEAVDISRETYLCLLMDREYNGPVLVASSHGGTSIEDVAEKTPHLVRKLPIDIHTGVTKVIADDIAEFLLFKGKSKDLASAEIEKLWKLFKAVDATQIEINPLVETPTGDVVSVDAKLNFDDNAEYRQKEIFAMDDISEKDPREVDAASYNLNYIGMTGNIGCLVNGAGLAMATMDIVKLHGGDPANFLDCGGGVQEDQVYHAFRILTEDKNVRCILVNVFGGIVDTATIANGIVNACRSINLEVPLVVRLEGNNVDEAKRIIAESGLPVQSASSMGDAAQKAVAALS